MDTVDNDYPYDGTDFRDVIVTVYGDEPEEVTVVVGDGNTVYDEDFPYDARVFFYFTDEAEFQSAFVEGWDGGDFTILSVV